MAAYFWPNWHHHETYGPPRWPQRPSSDAEDFGEWGVFKAPRPCLPGHAQQKVSDWGNEDESDRMVMARKIDAAGDHGVNALNEWTAGSYLAPDTEYGLGYWEAIKEVFK